MGCFKVTNDAITEEEICRKGGYTDGSAPLTAASNPGSVKDS